MDVRTAGRLIEVIHAPVYFAPEPQEEYAAIGLRGYWRGYFAGREAAALAEQDLPWPQPHLLLAETRRLDPRQREYRGFTEAEWDAAAEALRDRGLVGAAAAELVEIVEHRTDQLVADAFAATDTALLDQLLRPFAAAAVSALPFPNAVGLPDPS